MGKTYFAIITAQSSRTLGFCLQLTSYAIAAWIVLAFFTCAAIAFFVLFNDLVAAISTLDFQLRKQRKQNHFQCKQSYFELTNKRNFKRSSNKEHFSSNNEMHIIISCLWK